jgi:hypothetical protein
VLDFQQCWQLVLDFQQLSDVNMLDFQQQQVTNLPDFQRKQDHDQVADLQLETTAQSWHKDCSCIYSYRL